MLRSNGIDATIGQSALLPLAASRRSAHRVNVMREATVRRDIAERIVWEHFTGAADRRAAGSAIFRW
jgi:hypothetical protein